MGKTFAAIDDKIQNWIAKQHVFFVATAPLSREGHVNLSPKGNDTLRILDRHTLGIMDTGGSGIETVAHLRENQRIVIMMCAFEGPPKIYRFYGKGVVVTPNSDEFDELAVNFDHSRLGIRSIIKVELTRISDSCGYGVPLLTYQKDRHSASEYLKNNGVESVRSYQKENNLHSIDGLAGITQKEAESFLGPDSGG